MSVRLSDRSGRAGPVAGKGFCKHKSERCDTSVSPSHRMDRHPADLTQRPYILALEAAQTQDPSLNV